MKYGTHVMNVLFVPAAELERALFEIKRMAKHLSTLPNAVGEHSPYVTQVLDDPSQTNRVVVVFDQDISWLDDVQEEA